ncbi:MAG: O-antigen ligase family protein [Candidatus Buchananbacteria bacterium]
MNKLARIIEYLFYLFLFLLPWQTRLIWRDASLNGDVWEYGRLSLYGTEILFWGIILFFVIWLLLNAKSKKFNYKNFCCPQNKISHHAYRLIVVFCFLAGLSTIWSLDSALAYFRWIQFLEAICLVVIILNFNFKFERVVWVLTFSALTQSLLAIWQFLNQYIPANKWLGWAEHLSIGQGSIILETIDGRWLRAYGSLPHPNILGGFLALAIIFLIYLILKKTDTWSRIYVFASLIIITAGLFFTFSRSAWLALLLFFLGFAFWLGRQKNQLWQKSFYSALAVILATLIILISLFSGLLLSRINTQTELEAQSISLRVAYSRQALSLIKNDWLLGQGLGNYTLAIYQKYNSTWPGYYYQPVHNIYLLILAELGVFGILFFSLILILIFWPVWRRLKSWRDVLTLKLEKIILFFSLLVILFISLFDHYFWTIYFGLMIFWLVLGLNLKNADSEEAD